MMVDGFSWSLAAGLVLFAAGVVRAQYFDFTSPGKCEIACLVLSKRLGDKVSFRNSSIYDLEESDYWSTQQSTVTPLCRVTPSNSQDASTTIKAIRTLGCPFAIKSGGHAAFAGASNIQGGITIDLSGLKTLEVSADKKTVQVGAGNRWRDVYSNLDPQSLSAVGGRVTSIGVGGLTLGGGISFYSTRRGWACDNVVNYEVIFADGTIHNVNPSSFSDLFWALRGGGNNFGLVTRFDLKIFPNNGRWGGQRIFTFDKFPQLASAYVNFANNASNDLDAALFVTAAYDPASQQFVALAAADYSNPVVDPPIFDEFRVIPDIFSTMRITSMSDRSAELERIPPRGFRQSWWTFTTHTSVPLVTSIVDIWQSAIDPIKSSVSGFQPYFVIQPITTPFLTASAADNGPNALGLDLNGGPYTLYLVGMQWQNAGDDDAVRAAASDAVSRSTAAAKSSGLDVPFLYQNYASGEQDVFAGYGSTNLNKLVEIHQKYDPHGVFTKLQPGYFKIPEK